LEISFVEKKDFVYLVNLVNFLLLVFICQLKTKDEFLYLVNLDQEGSNYFDY